MVAGLVGNLLGGPWTWLGAGTFVVAVLLDLTALDADYSRRKIRHPRLAEIPIYLHVVLMPAMVVAAAWRIHASSAAGAPLGFGSLAGIAVSQAWLGVLPNIPALHELIHRPGRMPRFLGFLLTVVIADPLRRLAHLRSHHVKLGRVDDTDTARRGETIYAFMIRAAIGGTREAYESEKERLAKHDGSSVWSPRSDVLQSLVLTAAVMGLIFGLAGARAGVVIGIGFLLSRLMLESFNYLQHYGIVRAPDTRYQRRHTWSHLSPVVRAAGLEITNHAHHHMHPEVPFYDLVPDPTAPQMPSALLCFLAALVPPIWTRFIAMPRLRRWDELYASAGERELAAAANRAAGWPAWSFAPREGDATG
jgi:fatty acid desaturase